jgi:hypothetical protein
MMALLQLFGAIAIVLGLLGTWLAGQRRTGWLVCIVSTVLWLPALVSGEQWAAVVNCGLSVAICTRNFLAGAATAAKTSGANRARTAGRSRLSWGRGSPAPGAASGA